MSAVAMIELVRGKGIAIVDEQYAEAIRERRWCLHLPAHARTAYAATTSKPRVPLHIFVARLAGMDTSNEIDHIDRDGLNCTVANLRPATRAQNNRNCRVRKDSTTGYKGVAWEERRRFYVQIQCNKRRKMIAFIDTAESAARIYDAWAKEAHGEFAVLNFPDDDLIGGAR